MNYFLNRRQAISQSAYGLGSLALSSILLFSCANPLMPQTTHHFPKTNERGESTKPSDVVVYGATPAGVAAAIAASREGAEVLLVEELSRVGGMYTVGGMGLSDVFFMDRQMIDGLYEEIHGRVDQHYRGLGIYYRPDNHGDIFPKGKGRWYHEPKVVEKVLNEILAEAGVAVRLGERLVSAQMAGKRITSIKLVGGDQIFAEQFIDATYTGDLMAAAGVSYVVGRESADQYGERFAGQQNKFRGKRKVWEVDPRDEQGRLLPLMNNDDSIVAVAGDDKIMNYNYRVNLTDDPDNMVPIPKPENYDPAHFELLRRYFKRYGGDRVKMYPLPNRKYDLNDDQGRGFAIGLPGRSWDYPEADAATRRQIEKEHREFTLGYFHFILTDPSVPQGIREHLEKFGLPKDEHVNSGHFPEMIYIREGRRMMGEYVLTQHDIEETPTKEDGIGMGLGPITVHNVQRVAVEGGYLHEGSAHSAYDPHGDPYQIPYRSLVPKRGECANLIVPVCLSASHVAFSSVRLEPTWIVLGQSSGVAAAMAAQMDCTAQDVPYPALRRRLLAQSQVLDILPPR